MFNSIGRDYWNTIIASKENSSRIVLQLPVPCSRRLKFFHGVRTSDAHAAAKILRERVKQPDQILAGVGYSLGAIVLNHYVSSAGDDVALDVSVSISGALACKYQKDFARSRRVWQPVIVANMKDLYLWSKWGHRIYQQVCLSFL